MHNLRGIDIFCVKAIALISGIFLLLILEACGGASSDAGSNNQVMHAELRAIAKAASVPTKSTKRGMAYGGDSAADLTALSTGISWWYNWSPSPETAVANIYQSIGVSF